MSVLGTISALRALMDQPQQLHIPRGREEEIAALVAADIERHIRAMNPTAPEDAPICVGCAITAAGGAVSVLGQKYEPRLKTVTPDFLAAFMDHVAQEYVP